MLPVPAWHYVTFLAWSEELPNWALVPYGLKKFRVRSRNSLELPPYVIQGKKHLKNG